VSESVIWRRLDLPGHDAAVLIRTELGWELRGTTVFKHVSGPACIKYEVSADTAWNSRAGTVTGWLGGRLFTHTISRESEGWRLDGRPVPGLERLTDIDFGFTPATNLLHLRRVNLSPGNGIDLDAAWFDVGPNPTLRELKQHYRCVSATLYEYRSPGYHGQIELISRNGFVKTYPHLWIAEP